MLLFSFIVPPLVTPAASCPLTSRETGESNIGTVYVTQISVWVSWKIDWTDINNGKLNWNGFSWSFQQRTVCLKYEIVVPCAHGVGGGQQNPLKGRAAIRVGGAEGTA